MPKQVPALNTLLVIPARLHSTRLSEKLLLAETGQPLIQHTYENACRSKLASKVVVAADDPKIVETVEQFGGNVRLTDPSHASGTDRMAEVAESYESTELFVNVQGDEPELHPDDIDKIIELLTKQTDAQISTLASPITNPELLNDPACVKVVLDQFGYALYFSRSPIPHPRDESQDWFQTDPPTFLQHVGIYGFRRDFLLEFSKLPRPACEIVESLEQLRALHAGKKIIVGTTTHVSRGIDTRAEYDAFVTRQANC